jgi:hypothetical protein
MADDTRPDAPAESERPRDTRRDGDAAGAETPKAPQKNGPRLVGPEDEERRGGVPGLEKDD